MLILGFSSNEFGKNMNALINMVLRQLMRRAVNFGIGSGIKAISKRGAKPQQRRSSDAQIQADANHLRSIKQMRRAQRNLGR
jgi:hypothetical protein